MFKLSKFSPVARAIGVIGGTAALVTGVTFANLTSNTVALDPNVLASGTAHLLIGSNTEAFTTNPVAGINNDSLLPGVPSAPFTFYLKNDGDAPLDVTVHIPTVFSGSAISPSDVKLKFECGGDPVEYTLAEWAAGTASIPGGPLAAGGTWTCTEVATLSSNYAGDGGETVQQFRVEFVGTQPTPAP
jgi:hypothetical protein